MKKNVKGASRKTSNTLFIGLTVLFSLITVILTIVSFAGNNFITVGKVKINVNDGEPIIATEVFLSPGDIVQEDFFIENQGKSKVYYRIYFSNVSGELKDYTLFEISHQGKTLRKGKVVDLTKENALVDQNELDKNQKRTLTVKIYLPTDMQTQVINGELIFDTVVDAVQTRRNPNQLFD